MKQWEQKGRMSPLGSSLSLIGLFSSLVMWWWWMQPGSGRDKKALDWEAPFRAATATLMRNGHLWIPPAAAALQRQDLKLFQFLWGLTLLHNPPSMNTWEDCFLLGFLVTPRIEQGATVTFKRHMRNSYHIDILVLLSIAWRFVSPSWERRSHFLLLERVKHHPGALDPLKKQPRQRS